MKIKLLFLSLVGVLGLSGCEFSNEPTDDTPTNDEPTITELSFAEILSAADSFAEQDYKTLCYEVMYSYDLTSDDLDSDSISGMTLYQQEIYDVSTSGDYYLYQKQIMTTNNDAVEYYWYQETEVVSIDNEYKLSSVSYNGSLEKDVQNYQQSETYIKNYFNTLVSAFRINKDSINNVNSILSNPSYYKSGNDFTMKGSTTVEDHYYLSLTLSSLLEYDYEGIGSQKLNDGYKDASVDYEFSFNQYGYVLKDEMKVLDPIGYTLTMSDQSYGVEMVDIVYSTKLSYDEEIERVGLYEYVMNAD